MDAAKVLQEIPFAPVGSAHANVVALRNILVSMAVYYACYEFGTRYMFAPFDSLDPEELEEDDEEEYLEPMFLPFPGTYKELKPKPYAANDPEWRCFVKFSKDKDEAKRARG